MLLAVHGFGVSALLWVNTASSVFATVVWWRIAHRGALLNRRWTLIVAWVLTLVAGYYAAVYALTLGEVISPPALGAVWLRPVVAPTQLLPAALALMMDRDHVNRMNDILDDAPVRKSDR